MPRPTLSIGDTPAEAGLIEVATALLRALPRLIGSLWLGIAMTSLIAAAAALIHLSDYLSLLTLPIAAHGALRSTWAAARGLPPDPLRALALRSLPRVLIAAAPAGAGIVVAAICAIAAADADPLVALIAAGGSIAAALVALELLMLPVVVAGGLSIATARDEAARLRAIGGRGDAVRWTGVALIAGVLISAGLDEVGLRLTTVLPEIQPLAPLLREIARWTMFTVAAAGPVLYIARADARLRRG
jgi:hypothetical protein